MSRILIAYATGEGQTARIAGALTSQFEHLDHQIHLVRLGRRAIEPDPAEYDAVIVAASVHAGRHQKSALRFVRQHRGALAQRRAAFVSVSALAAATEPAGQREAREQAETFLLQSAWQPPFVELVGGAFRPSQLSWFVRVATTVMRKFFRRDLERLGWPVDFTHDQEFTDWGALRRFGERFAEGLGGAEGAVPVETAHADPGAEQPPLLHSG